MSAPPPLDAAAARRALVRATAAYVLGWSAHTTFLFHLAPIALRLAGAAERDPWVFAGTAVASTLAALPVGWLADRVPRRRVLRAGLLLLAASYVPLVALPPSLAGTLAATLLTGTGLSAIFVSFNSYVADLLSSERTGRAYGTTGALSVLAAALGPFVAAGVFALAGAPPVALRVAALLFLAGALAGAALTFRLPAARAGSDSAPAAADAKGVLRADGGTILPVVLVYVVQGAGYGATVPYFAVFFLDHVRLDAAAWGVVLGAGTVASALGSLAAGRLSARLPPEWLTVAPQAALLAATLAFLWPLPALALAAAFVARHLFATTVAPTLSMVLMSRVRPAHRARSQAWASLGWNVGWASGASVGGALLARLDGGLFPAGAALGLAGVAAGMALLRGRRLRQA